MNDGSSTEAVLPPSGQRADVLGFTPQGFAGYCIYPNTIYLCDLLIAFNQPLTAASIARRCGWPRISTR